MIGHQISLSALVEHSNRLRQIAKGSLRVGDCMIIKTCNSVYVMRALDHGFWSVSGGWFDRKGLSPLKVRINGCTWGGSAIKVDVAAACGLCLEFGNRLVTSPIRRIVIFRYGSWN